MTTAAYGFIDPDDTLRPLAIEEIHSHLDVKACDNRFRANFTKLRNKFPDFDNIADGVAKFDRCYEDQCSAKYYFDLFQCVLVSQPSITRLIEVGVFLGGASTILAGCGTQYDLDLDMIDLNPRYLRFAHERARRCFPEYAGRIRLFHGDLPTYVRDVLMKEQDVRAMVQHDGSHAFNQVVYDLSSLYYVKDKIHSLAIQDTHLRSHPKYHSFVDAAAYAVFGFDMKYSPIGVSYAAHLTQMTNPSPAGNYFLPDAPEGWFIEMKDVTFKYPHPSIPFEAFFSEPAE